MPHGAPVLDLPARAKHPRPARSVDRPPRRGCFAPTNDDQRRRAQAAACLCVTLAKSYNPLRYTEIQKVNCSRGRRPGRVACAMGRAVTG